MTVRNVRRGRMVKAARREEAIERAKNYKKPEIYTGLREQVKHGIISVEDALSAVQKSSEAGVLSTSFVEWLGRKKNFKAKSTKETKADKKKGKRKRKDVSNKNDKESS